MQNCDIPTLVLVWIQQCDTTENGADGIKVATERLQTVKSLTVQVLKTVHCGTECALDFGKTVSFFFHLLSFIVSSERMH